MATKELTPEDRQARQKLAIQATYQTDTLLDIFAREFARDDTAFELVAPSLLARMKDLNSVIMAAISGDDGHPTEEMHAVVHGGAA